ncbi:P-loop NTPase fold protein [Paenibacillus arenilitoris]|uniref:KAP NTPase domain-containing protein n=1 Tax=Paenibacillus arenilitoris TaxID=2772299 RepID=A0A927H6R0_9BACL|nr:P-loop NTPase fold protein [Paenibacillus arenilitoris]MBD2870826.1 hypothetical protein [Paenibacillus arenilitoris]
MNRSKKRLFMLSIFAILISYFICIFLRITLHPLLITELNDYQTQFVLILYVLLFAAIGWGFRQLLRRLKHRTILLKCLFPAFIVGMITDYVINDQYRWFSGSFWSDLYDSTIILFMMYYLSLFFLISVSYDGTKNENKSSDQEKKEEDRFHARPSLGNDQDELNRDEFARHMAGMLNKRLARPTNHALTIGLYGPWGTGKSSVFDLIENHYMDQSKVTIIRFHPWYMGKDQNNIIPEFLKVLINKLSSEYSHETTLLRLLSDYMKYLTPLSVRPPGMIVNFKEFTSNPEFSKDYIDAQSMRESIIETLKRRSIPLLVFIDDIDRLDNKEIQMIFKLVRLIADFPNTTFVIAMDEEVVAKSLSQLYSKDYETRTGLKYLEKFIHVPLYLPRADPVLLFGLLLRKLKPILAMNGAKLDEGYLWDLHVQFSFTPRNIERLVNIVQVHLPLLKEEVYVEDLVSLLAIKIDNPELFACIYSHRSLFTGALNAKNQEKQAALEKVKKQFDSYSPWLERMFPALLNKETVEGEHKLKRIGSYVHFETYFMYSVSNRKISQRKLNAFYEILITGNQEAAADLYEAMVVESNLEETNNKIKWNLDRERDELNIKLLSFFLNRYGTSRAHSSVKDLRDDLMRILLEGESAKKVYSLIINHPDRLTLAAEAYGIRASGDPGFKNDIKQYVRENLTADAWFNMHDEQAKAVTDILKDGEERKELRKRIEKWFKDKPIWRISAFLMGNPLEDELMQLRQYASLITYIPVDYIERDIEKIKNDRNDSESSLLSFDTTSRYREILIKAHYRSYDYAEERLEEMLNKKNEIWSEGFLKSLQQLADHGLPERSIKIKELLHLFKSQEEMEASEESESMSN